MTESTPEIQALDEGPTTRDAVYDEAELHYVDPVADETAKQTASRLNKGNEVGRADGSSGNRFTVRQV